MNIQKSQKLYSFAKINLFFNIVSKRQDNYHQIETIMQTIDLKDEIMIKNTNKSIIIKCNNSSIPLDNRNTVYRAAELMINRYHLDEGYEIEIKKGIPQGAGLAGGSGNAAAVILGIRDLKGLNISDEELVDLGKAIGADVPFCIFGGTCLAQGAGEKLTRLKDFYWQNILVVKPQFGIATKDIYGLITPEMFNRYDINILIDKINEGKDDEVILECKSALEDIVIEIYPEIKSIKNHILKTGGISAQMTGTGSAVIGFYPDSLTLNQAATYFRQQYKEIYITRTTREGIENGEKARCY
ncbi:MAG: 4-diphosphocytidyl-2-C-methyl-D-erythritol kinase [Clostridiales bacterium 38_11]|nr:MAG: 4-diphosphocytidyl-2-C-methyl-D-erythritol kinase [Clostridiales bacterium 38_11]HBH13729.1 4-(cytidine 5'-diphospho)-2-C-methyl-D-erythritol kinase [Clostridiales bacterium]